MCGPVCGPPLPKIARMGSNNHNDPAKHYPGIEDWINSLIQRFKKMFCNHLKAVNLLFGVHAVWQRRKTERSFSVNLVEIIILTFRNIIVEVYLYKTQIRSFVFWDVHKHTVCLVKLFSYNSFYFFAHWRQKHQPHQEERRGSTQLPGSFTTLQRRTLTNLDILWTTHIVFRGELLYIKKNHTVLPTKMSDHLQLQMCSWGEKRGFDRGRKENKLCHLLVSFISWHTQQSCAHTSTSLKNLHPSRTTLQFNENSNKLTIFALLDRKISWWSWEIIARIVVHSLTL